MGRRAGYLALNAGIACGATAVLVPEVEFDIEKELGIEIVNDTKVKIAIEEDEEPWDIIGESEEDIEKKIDEERNRQAEIDNLKTKVNTDEYIEKIAREQYGYAMPEERVYYDSTAS